MGGISRQLSATEKRFFRFPEGAAVVVVVVVPAVVVPPAVVVFPAVVVEMLRILEKKKGNK